MIDKWNGYKNALRDLLTKPTGTVDMEDGMGAVVTLPTYPALQKGVADLIAEGTGAAASAQASATSAQGSANVAASSATEALQHAQDAGDQATAASASAEEAGASADAARSSYADSAAQASASATSATASADSASLAESQAVLAQSSASASEASATTASLQAGNAADSAAEAQSWALTAQTTVTGLLHYMGSWDASQGTFPPNPVKGDFWKVGRAGVVGGTDLAIGDQIIYGGSGWDKIDNTESVTAVAGKVGNVTLAIADIDGLQGSLDAKASEASPTFSGTVSFSTFLASTNNAAVLATPSNGAVFLRPVSPTDATGQFKVDTAGFSWNGNIGWHAGNFDPASKAASVHTHSSSDIDFSMPQDTAPNSLSGKVRGTWITTPNDTPYSYCAVFNLPTNGNRDAQLGWFTGAGDPKLVFRQRADSSNVWQAWLTVWTSMNFNPANYVQKDTWPGLSGLTITGTGNLYRRTANGAADVYQPRVFVQGSDPGAGATDGDLWIW